MRKSLSLWLICAAAVLALSGQVAGQKLNVVSWSGKADKSQVRPGEAAKLLLTAKIEPNWHMYSLTQPPPPRATKIALAEGSAFTLDGAPKQPAPIVAYDPNFEINTQTFENSVTFTVPVKANTDAAPGPQKVIAKVTFQACDEHQCLPPRTKEIEIEIMIAQAAAVAAVPKTTPTATPVASVSPSVTPTAKSSPSPSPSATVSPSPSASVSPSPTATPGSSINPAPPSPPNPGPKLRQNGLLSYLWLALVSGLLSLLTPCVFPMIPITVSFFTKSEQQSRGAAVGHALVYCVGMVLTYTGLGMAMALLSSAAGLGNLAANPWMNLILTTVFVVFALNLFGMFEIRVPSGLLSKLDSRAKASSWIGTLLMGLTFTLTSFTCTAAFVGTVLVAATQGEKLWAAIGMMVFSSAFAFPFFLLALFPRWLKSLPKSGGWLNSVKVVMGFLELAAAFKFISNVDQVWGWSVFTRTLVLAAWIAISIVTAVYLLGKFQLPYDTAVERLGVVRMMMSVFFLGIAFYLLTGLFGGRLGELDSFLPILQPGELAGIMRGGTTTGAGNSQAKWLESYDDALQLAKAQNKPVFLNFTGVTCTNCRWMETNMFTQAEVKKELERYILAELFTDRQTPEHVQGDERNQKLQEEKFGTVALPLYVIVRPDGETVDKFPGLTRDKNEFIRFLQSGTSQSAQVAQRQ
ncbi:MAG TPA: cytochrome c biogenesis protein CcdA [Blastocatellia bacterium]|nr:cytochrome c biogenesis protein CcdA [Blastocatellia bacterium]